MVTVRPAGRASVYSLAVPSELVAVLRAAETCWLPRVRPWWCAGRTGSLVPLQVRNARCPRRGESMADSSSPASALPLEVAVVPLGLGPERRAALGLGRARLLAAASAGYNAIEALVAIAAGAAASSVALVGFGLDSIVEMSSALIILWQFHHHLPESRERQALRMIAVSFFALAGYVTFESVRTLIGGHEAERSTVGIALAAASLLIMPMLSWAQRRTGRTLGSTTVVADSKQTLLCSYLSAVLLVGLLLNATSGGGGPTRSSASSSPVLRCARGSRLGGATRAARRYRTWGPWRLARPEPPAADARRAGRAAATASAQDRLIRGKQGRHRRTGQSDRCCGQVCGAGPPYRRVADGRVLRGGAFRRRVRPRSRHHVLLRVVTTRPVAQS